MLKVSMSAICWELNPKSCAYPKVAISPAGQKQQLFVHLLIQQILIEYLLQPELLLGMNKIPGPCPYGDYILADPNPEG